MKYKLLFLLFYPVFAYGEAPLQEGVSSIQMWYILLVLIVASIVSVLITRSYFLRKLKRKVDRRLFDDYTVRVDALKKEKLMTFIDVVSCKNNTLSDIRSGLEGMRNSEAKLWVNKIATKMCDENKQFSLLFSEAYPGFIDNLKVKHPKLTEKDVKMLSLLRIGLDVDKLSLLLDISASSVTANRYRLKSKMGIAKEVKLEEYLGQF